MKPPSPFLLTRACGGELSVHTPGTQGNKAGPQPRWGWGVKRGRRENTQTDLPTEGIDSLPPPPHTGSS